MKAALLLVAADTIQAGVRGQRSEIRDQGKSKKPKTKN